MMSQKKQLQYEITFIDRLMIGFVRMAFYIRPKSFFLNNLMAKIICFNPAQGDFATIRKLIYQSIRHGLPKPQALKEN